MSIYVDIEKNFGDFHLDVEFSAEDEILSLFGASGCGKSMTLKCIAGIVKPDRGKIVLDGVTLFDSEKRIDLSAQERHTGLLFQNYALFPNMTVEQNIRAGARREKNTTMRERMVHDVMDSFGLQPLAGRYPAELSGGQQQRTALARIIVSAPQILLLDEPFSALDSHLRFRLEREVSEILRTFRKTVLFVSHDRGEVYRLSDKIAVMNDGKIEMLGEKERVFAHPTTKTAAILTGCKNISAVRRIDETHVFAEEWGIPLTVPQGKADAIGVRDIAICAENGIHCRVVGVTENPDSVTIFLRPVETDKNPLAWEMGKEEWSKIAAEELSIAIEPQKILLLKG